MPHRIQPPETDLLLPLPADGEEWDPHTIHTHYFGFGVPERAIGVFVYIRYMPHFPLCQGGVYAFQGMDNLALTEMAHSNYLITMPWPQIEGNRITTQNGLSVDFVEPGKRVLISYRSTDGSTSIDVEGNAVTPLAARGHVIPGEEFHQSQQSGGSEQFMRYTGELVLQGERHEVDCLFPRDRSWRQVRAESRDANLHPPVFWTPICFGEDFAFNQAGFESPDTDPEWAGVYDVPADAPTHHFAWVSRNGEVRDVARVRLNVTERHPLLFAPTRMEIEAEDEAGEVYRLTGEATALTPMLMWPNIATFDSVFRWEDEQGRTTHATMQGMHSEAFAHTMKARRAAVNSAP